LFPCVLLSSAYHSRLPPSVDIDASDVSTPTRLSVWYPSAAVDPLSAVPAESRREKSSPFGTSIDLSRSFARPPPPPPFPRTTLTCRMPDLATESKGMGGAARGEPPRRTSSMGDVRPPAWRRAVTRVVSTRLDRWGGPHSGPHVARVVGSLPRRGDDERPREELENGNDGGEEGGANGPER
jgi:hypothetical protein